MASFVVMMVEYAGATGWSARDVIRRVGPKTSQQVLAVVIYFDNGSVQWDAVIHRPGGEIVSLNQLQIVGPEMATLQRTQGIAEPSHGADADALDKIPDRWSRSVGAIGESTWRKIQGSRVTLVGASRNGSAMAFQLAALGIGHLCLVDPDVLEPHNLDAMPGMSAKHIGLPKVQALAKRLVAFQPNMSVTGIQLPVNDATARQRLWQRPSDLYISAVDSDVGRMATSLLAANSLTPHLDVASTVTRDDSASLELRGDARLFLPSQGCVYCVGGLIDENETFYQLAAPPNTLRRGDSTEWHVERTGSLVTINGMIVSLGVQMWISLLSGELRRSCWNRLRYLADTGLQSTSADVERANDCRFCRQRTSVKPHLQKSGA